MKKYRLIKSALIAICRNPTRTFLTTLGIVIGISSVIALMEIGTGASEVLAKNFADMGAHTIRIFPGTVIRGGVSSGAAARANLTVSDLNAILKNCQYVQAGTPFLSVRGQIIYGGKNWSPYFISGVNENYFDIAGWKIEEGEPFSASHVRRGSKVCLVGETIVRELYGGENPVGKDLRIQNVVFKVIGVLKSKGANMMGMDQDDCVIAPWTSVKMRLRGAGSTSLSSASASASVETSTAATDTYVGSVSLYPPKLANMPPVRFSNIDSIMLAATSADDVYKAMAEVGQSLRESHKLEDHVDDDFRIRAMAEFADMWKSSTKTTTNLLLCVAFISLIVGGVGIMNIMLVSVTERTREIGLRMAVGARGSDILKQFLIESIVICLVGGIIGIFAGHAFSIIMSKFMGWPVAISYVAIVISFGVSALVGIVFGYYPAWKAARLDPIEALRYE